VIIGIDPHKGSHTAVAIDAAETQLGKLRVRAGEAQAARLTEWAAAWPERTWAVEGAGGLGHLLAQQLVAAGEQVLDVQPKLGARVRLLSDGRSGKSDPNDARSVAIAALCSPVPRAVVAETRAQQADRFQRLVNNTQLTRLNEMIRVLDEYILDSSQNFTYIVIDDLDKDWVDERSRTL
jgi:transposase